MLFTYPSTVFIILRINRDRVGSHPKSDGIQAYADCLIGWKGDSCWEKVNIFLNRCKFDRCLYINSIQLLHCHLVFPYSYLFQFFLQIRFLENGDKVIDVIFVLHILLNHKVTKFQKGSSRVHINYYQSGWKFRFFVHYNVFFDY